jgi:predicted PurR-regulated permease PerM
MMVESSRLSSTPVVFLTPTGKSDEFYLLILRLTANLRRDRISPLSGSVVATVVVLALYAGRAVLVPIAVAILLTFLLNPMVRFLERRHVSRLSSVIIAASVSGTILMSLGWIATRQVTGMLAELPRNTANIKERVKTLRELATAPFAKQFGRMVTEISQASQLPADAMDSENTDSTAKIEQPEASAKSIIVHTEPTPWLRITGYLGSVFEVLATFAFALVLLIVFLLERDDLRDRIVLLAGKARLALTSKALEDVTDRISRYLVMLAIVNGSYGIMLTVGLYFCGVPYALLWGFVAAGLRFIPYIGPWVGAIFPMTMSLAISTGWGQPIAVFGFIAILELVSNNVIEPLMFGRSTGVSPTALLISAAFWLLLWGPIGLMLSTPFAVCFVVLGKNIPQLNFLNLLLSDKPAFRENVSIYMRLMQGDEQEATRLVVERIKDSSADEVFDEMLLPALNYTKRDVMREYLTEADRHQVLKGMRESLRETHEFRRTVAAQRDDQEPMSPDGGGVSSAAMNSVRILGCPAADEIDCVGLEMLRQLLDPNRWVLELTVVETLTSELATRIVTDPPAFLCIASLPPGGLGHARYLCKRLRAASPEIQIIVGRWGRQRKSRIDRERLQEAGANFVTTTLQETCTLLESRLLLKLPQVPSTAPSGPKLMESNARSRTESIFTRKS